MKSRRQGYVKYKGLGIQRKTSEEVNRETYGILCGGIDSIKKYSEVKTVCLYENPFSGEYEQNYKI